ncbi:hypothetical protein H2198_003761 [Neophaeococcomyces mojaviensis]|uniref:Uncharacterized protein n=1 Tax=Neophaeococcomyces mojaviensis TaxID=3383035 RepID=A0ACC3AAI3_9EURO|nr:hypothetical protein H2198_003761 [Knufia sp. JES_112]
MSARISPAASLLRNSKLFALPPTIALPAAPPSSDQVASSDTATTLYPTHAAIQTTSISLSRGDWGFKRPLPSKAFNKTNNPVVRLVRGIDTPEHVADFESAADHVLTLRKFQELNHPLRHPEPNHSSDRRDFSVFRPTHDNTTNLSGSAPAADTLNGVWPRINSVEVSEQLPSKIRDEQIKYEEEKKAVQASSPIDPSGAQALMKAVSHPGPPQQRERRRWRYAGPSLVQMTGLEFDEYLQSFGHERKTQLRNRIKKEIVRDILVQAREEGKMDHTIREEDVTEKQITDYLRYLRSEPGKFGPILAEILDLPDGVPGSTESRDSDAWEYGRDTLAAVKEWQQRGPPRTHPSAGLSYVHSMSHANNHPEYGPQKLAPAVLARAVKQKLKAGGSDANYGVAGFIVPRPDDPSMLNKGNEQYQPQRGGLKVPLRPGPASITETGALRLHTSRVRDYSAEDDKAVFTLDINRRNHERDVQQAMSQPKRAPSMSGVGELPTNAGTRRTSTQEVKQRDQIEPSQDIDAILQQVNRLGSGRR